MRLRRYVVKLGQKERTLLLKMIHNGAEKAKKLTHARILLQADSGKQGEHRKPLEIAENLHVDVKTIHRVKKKYVEHGLSAALNRKPHSRYRPRKLDGEKEAYVVAMCCSPPPKGQARWTLALLADRLVAQNTVKTISRSTLWRTLKKTNLNLG